MDMIVYISPEWLPLAANVCWSKLQSTTIFHLISKDCCYCEWSITRKPLVLSESLRMLFHFNTDVKSFSFNSFGPGWDSGNLPFVSRISSASKSWEFGWRYRIKREVVELFNEATNQSCFLLLWQFLNPFSSDHRATQPTKHDSYSAQQREAEHTVLQKGMHRLPSLHIHSGCYFSKSKVTIMARKQQTGILTFDCAPFCFPSQNSSSIDLVFLVTAHHGKWNHFLQWNVRVTMEGEKNLATFYCIKWCTY